MRYIFKELRLHFNKGKIYMKKITLLVIIILNYHFLYAQNTFRAIVKVETTSDVLIGVNAIVENSNIGNISDTNGFIEIKNIPDGEYCIVFSFLGYEKKKLCYTFPLKNPEEIISINLKPKGNELEEIVVSSTRTNTRIEDLPIKVEVIGQEDVDEKVTKEQSDISRLLTEYIGIQTQQTSQTSGNIDIRMQGLDGGKYVKILQDGFPLNDGFSGGLSIMEIPPLDLKQVEIIKGVTSTLFGGDAIAGSINLISKGPGLKHDFSLFLSQSTLNESSIGTFFSTRKDKFGITLLASFGREGQVDINKDGFSEQPKVREFTINPKLFYYFDDSTKLMFGITTGNDERTGGDMNVLNGHPDSLHSYFEKNTTSRNFSQLEFEKSFANGNVFTIKNSVALFDRSIDRPNNEFHGKQISSWSEISFLHRRENNDFVTGINFSTDKFSEDTVLTHLNRGFDYNTFGIFVQDDWKVGKTTLEAGVRSDFHNKYGIFILPHLAVLHRWNEKFSSRIGGGFGYKIPTFFDDDGEEQGFGKNVLPLGNLKPETSISANLDFNYKTLFADDFRINVNESFFYAIVQNTVDPVGESLNSNGFLIYENDDDPVWSAGAETNIILNYKELNFIVGYTFVSAQEEDATHQIPITPKNSVFLDLLYDMNSNWKLGAEAFYTGRQYLRDSTQRQGYWQLGGMIQKKIKNFTVSINLENLLNVRQSNYEPLHTGTSQNPVFKEIWAPLEGFKAIVSVKISF
jgi:outer membrane receptor for ferrienterochelin and colicins